MIGELVRILRNEEGLETLEWIAMAFLIIILVAVVAYPGTLLTSIQSVITNVGSHI
jgi:Flp pilus assembly pilin Flp